MVKSFLDSECVNSSAMFLTRLVTNFPLFLYHSSELLSACPTVSQIIASSINLLLHLLVCPTATSHKNAVIFFLCQVPFYTLNLNCPMASNLNAVCNLPSSHSEMPAPSTTLVFVHSILLPQ